MHVFDTFHGLVKTIDVGKVTIYEYIAERCTYKHPPMFSSPSFGETFQSLGVILERKKLLKVLVRNWGHEPQIAVTTDHNTSSLLIFEKIKKIPNKVSQRLEAWIMKAFPNEAKMRAREINN